MKKILFCIIGCFIVLPLGADNVTTTKPYVDYHVGQKQDKIPGIPADYTPVEYISNDASTYINTGIMPNTSNVELEIRYYCNTTSSLYLFQSRNSSSGTLYGFSGSSTGATLNATWGGTSLRSDLAPRTIGHIYRMNMRILDGAMSFTVVDETTGQSNTKTGTVDASAVPVAAFGLFGNTGGNKINAGQRIFYAWIKVNGKYVMNYIPVTNNGTAGFYDTVSGTFKGATAGTLNAGPVGTGAIVTYGATDGSIGSAVITDKIGTDTTESTIPTTGATVEALGDKMGTVGAGADFVMAGEIVGGGTSTAHAKKPVYSSTNNYNDALVTATVVNNNARSAANNELSCLDNDCTLWQIGSAAQLDTTCKASDVPCINSDECCSNSCVLGQCFAACVSSGGLCTKTSQCCSGLQCLLNKCSALEKLCESDKDCSGLTPYCCNSKCQAKACVLCAEQGESCGSTTPCCAGLTCHAGKPSVCVLTKS